MDSFSIGISGLTASQRALDVIGNNIANAATEGYHRQRIDLAPAASRVIADNIYGGGVEVANVSRIYDTLLEQEIRRQTSDSEQVGRELDTLKTVESAMGDMATGGGLSADIESFFNALQDLAVHPTDSIYQQQVVTAGQKVTSQFNTLGSYFNNLELQIVNEADNTLDEINALSAQIAQLNGTIEDIELRGKQAANLRDSRDKCISDLSKLIGIQTIARENGTVDVSFNGTGLVTNRTSVPLAIKLQSGSMLGICPAGDDNYQTDISGGKLGGLFSLKNQLLPEFHDQIDNLAETMVAQINKLHVQGVSSSGSFSSLTGWEMIDQRVAAFEPPVNDGKIYVRLTNQTTGETTRQDVDVLTTDTLSDVAARLDALTGIRASVVSGRLHIEAESDYKFDFLPGAISTPTTSNLTGTAAPSISGLYTGSIDQIYTCTVTGSGRIGVDSPLALEVKDQDGNLVKTINLGQGYVAGMKILINDATPEINAPLAISFNQSGKTLVDGESFTIEAIANSDTSGLLAAAGINAFFSGSNAANIAIVDEIVYDTSKVATAGGAEFTDNHTIRTMADLGQTQLTDLGNKRFGDYYRNISTQLGHTIDISDLNQKDSEGLLQNLANQQDLVSGVDINDEAAQLLVFERMFQASSKYMQTVKSSMDTLMQLIS